MPLQRTFNRDVATITVSVRPAKPRVGNVHSYVLNDTLLRDVFTAGRWVTVAATAASGSVLQSLVV
jgi:hypothetical protein